jgi:hypothetical protein
MKDMASAPGVHVNQVIALVPKVRFLVEGVDRGQPLDVSQDTGQDL